MTDKYGKGGFVQISTLFRLFTVLLVEGSSETGDFRHLEREHFYHIYWLLWTYLSWKMSLLVICKIFGLFLNSLTTDDKYSLLNRDNILILQPLQMQLFQKPKAFLNFFLHFRNLCWILNIFNKKMTQISYGFLNLHNPQNVVRWLSKKSRFRGPFDK